MRWCSGTGNGTEMDAHDVRRPFRKVITAAGLDATQWTPREPRHSFVSLLSASGVRIEDVSRLVGHSGTAVTEKVHRHELHAVRDDGAIVTDELFPLDAGQSLSQTLSAGGGSSGELDRS